MLGMHSFVCSSKKKKICQTNQKLLITIRQNVNAKSNYGYRPQNWIAQSSMLPNFLVFLVGAGLGEGGYDREIGQF